MLKESAALMALLALLGIADQARPQDHNQQQHEDPSPAAQSLPGNMLLYYEPHHWDGEKHPFSNWCCNRNDCGFAKPGSVVWSPDGYRVRMPDGHFQVVPEDSPAIRPVYEPGFEDEHRFAACILPKKNYIAPWLDEFSPGASDSPSEYYVRCLYVGRSGN